MSIFDINDPNHPFNQTGSTTKKFKGLTVGQIVEKLQALPQDKPVVFDGEESGSYYAFIDELINEVTVYEPAGGTDFGDDYCGGDGSDPGSFDAVLIGWG